MLSPGLSKLIQRRMITAAPSKAAPSSSLSHGQQTGLALSFAKQSCTLQWGPRAAGAAWGRAGIEGISTGLSFCHCSRVAPSPHSGVLRKSPARVSAPPQLTQINLLRQERAHLQFVEIPRIMNIDPRPH